MRGSESTREQEPPTGKGRVRTLLLGVAVFLFGIGVAVYLHWPALVHYGTYKSDIKQSPHWAAYHTSSFQPEDLVVRYASFNESPLQNGIYWIGTRFVDLIPLTKVLAVASYSLLALIFFFFGRAMYGVRFGLLLVLFIMVFPDQWEYSAGFFSKFWMIPLLLVCVFVLQTDRWWGLIPLLPFAAVAYPVTAVLIGMTASVYCIQELFRNRGRARRLFAYLAIGSILAVALLLVKYHSPPEFIGPMRAGVELREMPEVQMHGYPSRYIPVPPLASELIRHVEHPFVLLSAIFYLLVLGRTAIWWERSWTALFIASVVGYLLADYFFLRFYVPNRYTRYSIAVLLALWNARNWDLILARLQLRSVRYGLVFALLLVGGYMYRDTLEPGKDTSDNGAVVPICRFIREELPEGILVAGAPGRLDDVAIQSRRSVLAPFRLAHPWFVTYYDEIRERTRATLRAHFADGPEPFNELHRRYGATHFFVRKSLFWRVQRSRRLYAEPYNWELYAELAGRRQFYLSPPPPGLFLWEDANYAVFELPIPVDENGGGTIVEAQ